MAAVLYWDIDPSILAAGALRVRWYGLLFALAFYAGYQLFRWFYRVEQQDPEELDRLLLYVMLGAIPGARLGHCLFYGPAYYLSHPVTILKIWEGGLASHGAAAGVLLAISVYVHRHPQAGYLWLLDRMAVAAALGGSLIRVGNFFNSEILGTPSDLPWAVVFIRSDSIPRHPTQLYEALAYLLIFLFLLARYRRPEVRCRGGLLLGLFLLLVFTFRFAIEFVKMSQTTLDVHLPLSMGQLLSIPLILVGLGLVARARQPR